ncbi:MAG: helix-turn-helix domain-containing protein [Armatimonadota bacterium]
MGDYDSKLDEWLKYLQQQVKPTDEETQETVQSVQEEKKAEPVSRADDEPWLDPDRVVVRDRMGRVIPDETEDIDSSSMIIDPSVVERQPEFGSRGAGVFEDSDVPEVEDFLPFLKETEPEPFLEERESKPFLEEPEPGLPPARDRGIRRFDPQLEPPIPPAEPEVRPTDRLSHLSEGTGEPKPIVRDSEPPQAVVEPKMEPKVVDVQPKPSGAAAKRVSVRQPRRKVQPPATPSASEVRELWDKLPRHIQLLVGQTQQEVAQRSYKRFKETREDLIARLLDPTLSLEETARILNVCPTTVRRYTNRGALKHLRTVGNQRRFRLSDILAFLESQPGTDAESDE